ncbi:MAG: DUF3176 domain-containing protein, partial [Cytophagaceae bacterium]
RSTARSDAALATFISAPNASTLHFVHDQLYQAVRAVDPNHIVIIEDGYKNLDQMPDPRIMGWKNVMYSLHSYKFDAKSADDYDGHLKWWVMAQSKGVQDKWQVPVYVGEWNLEPHGNPEKARLYAQTFDDATRGPWGATVLLCSRSIRPLASLGAVITILALAYDPFLQQLVRYPIVRNTVPSDEAVTKKAISLDATSNFSRWDNARAAASIDLDQFDHEPTCPTGNCTWPTFASLGYCSKCNETTAQTSLNCTTIVGSWNAASNLTCDILPEQGYSATVWQGHESGSYDSADAIVWRVRETAGRPWNDAVINSAAVPRAWSLGDPAPNSSFQSGYSFLGVESPIKKLSCLRTIRACFLSAGSPYLFLLKPRPASSHHVIGPMTSR